MKKQHIADEIKKEHIEILKKVFTILNASISNKKQNKAIKELIVDSLAVEQNKLLEKIS